MPDDPTAPTPVDDAPPDDASRIAAEEALLTETNAPEGDDDE